MPPPIEGPSEHFFTPEAIQQMASEIAEAGGVEVFFIGRRGTDGLVTEVESHAYGNPGSVPAPVQQCTPGDVFIHNHPGGNLMPSDPDIAIASSVGSMGIGCYIIASDARTCRVVVKPQDAKKKAMVAEEEVIRILSPRGGLSAVVKDFEDRPQQRDMARRVAEAFNNDGIAVVEAGTGTGKSFAYLLPSLLFALRNKERVVISTNTINLQEQLLHKDIPALRAAVSEEFEVEIVKGRGNYVCKRKAEYARNEASTLLEDDFQRELREVLSWAAESATGDLQELPISPRGEVWDRVKSESDNCLRVRCPFYEECFFYNSRRRAARARLLIVNHSLLMSDLAVRRASGNYTAAAVLPPYSRVILDEAHNLEEAAQNNLSQQITRPGLRQALSRLYRRDGGSGKGVLASLSDELDGLIKRRLIDPAHPAIMELATGLSPRVADVREAVDFLFGEFTFQFQRTQGLDAPNSREERKIRITPMLRATPIWREECERVLNELAGEIAAFVDSNTRLLEKFGELDENIVMALTNPMMEWQALVARLDGVRRTLLLFIADDKDNCRWVDIANRPGVKETSVRLCIAPVDVRQLLRESLHDRMKSEVLTSATLTVDKTFEFFQERSGLPIIRPEAPRIEYTEEGLPIIERSPIEARHISTDLLPTPFDYRQQVYLGVPMDFPDPREPAYDERLADLVNRSVAITGGRAFILFTSYAQMNRVARACEATIRRLGINLLKQGEESRDLLLRRFREDETSVLFATSSFWEGVDVKGRALELLIIAKLPFSVPTEPIQEAQFEALKAQGRDPFDCLVVPRAVIKLKQGFGRLIRSRTDRGAVIIADKRVVQMRYGKRFLNSLPDVDVRRAPALDLMDGMKAFFAARPPG